MKPNHILLIALIAMFTGCASTPKVTKAPPRKKAPEQGYKDDKMDCQLLYKDKGTYAAVFVQKCKLAADGQYITTVAIAVLDPAKEGKLAADESARMLVKHFGGMPQMTLLTMGNANGVVIYLFIVTDVVKGSYTPTRRLKRLTRSDTWVNPYQPKYVSQPTRP